MTTVIREWYWPDQAEEIEDFDLHTPAGYLVDTAFYETDRNVITILPEYDIDYDCFGEYLPFLLDLRFIAGGATLIEIEEHVRSVVKGLEEAGEILKYRKMHRDQE